MTWTWVEPFAGAAACALRLVGGEAVKPPVAWMGGKRRLARAILDAMGVPEEPPSSVLLADAGPWGWVWPLLLESGAAARVALVLRSWAGEHPRELWQRLASRPPAEDLHERAAQWLWLQARSASGVPIWWDGWRSAEGTRWEAPNGRGTTSRPGFNTGQAARDRGEDLRWPGHQAQRQAWLASDGRGQPRPAGARAVGGRWEKGNEGRVQDATNGQRGAWKFAGRPDRAQEERPAAMSGDHTLANWRMGEEQKKSRRGTANGRTGGMVNPATIASRIAALAEAFRRVEVTVRHGDAGGLTPPTCGLVCEAGRVDGIVCAPDECDLDTGVRSARTWCYLDPPYVGATGYGWDMPRAEVLALARRWADAGAVVAISEAEPLELDGWHHLELTQGKKPEWLTVSRPPVRLPERQGVLFTEGAA